RRLEKRGNFTDGPFVVPSGNGTRTPDDRVQSQRTRDFRRRPATGTPLIPNRIVKPGHWRFNTRDQANLRIFSFLLAAAIIGGFGAGDIVIRRMPRKAPEQLSSPALPDLARGRQWVDGSTNVLRCDINCHARRGTCRGPRRAGRTAPAGVVQTG